MANISLSHQDLKYIEDCAKFSGYELEKAQAKLGKLVMDALKIEACKATLAGIPQGCNKRRVAVYIDTINLNGSLTGDYKA